MIVTVAGAGGWLAGCGAKKTAAYKSNVVLPQEASNGVPGRADQDLSQGQRSRVLADMRAVAAGHQAVDPPGRAPDGVRWADIPLALRNAGREAGIELVAVTTRVEPDRYVFTLKTVEQWPGRLVIRRAGEGKVYEIEEIWLGRFPQEKVQQQRAEKLVKAFEKELKRLGGIEWFNE